MNKTADTESYESLAYSASERAGRWLTDTNNSLVTVESCTGGGIAFAITRIAGSSAWFECSFVTYSNLAKQQMVDVDVNLLKTYGAVSEEVAAAMAQGGLANSTATISLSVTGIAGPDGGSSNKPVGTVCFGRAQEKSLLTTTRHFTGDRQAVRNKSILFALDEWLKVST